MSEIRKDDKVPFYPANILLPKEKNSAWPVVACDQFTSEPEYWEKAEKTVGDTPSALRLILPEVYLSAENQSRIDGINASMQAYLRQGLFEEYPDSMIYVERTLPQGKIRRGIVGCIDLEAYDFHPEKKAVIRATEGTVLERIPPRVEIRRDAPLELPHVMLLIDDNARTVIEPLKDADLKTVYDLPLMLGGGHLCGKLIPRSEIGRIRDALAHLYDEHDGFLFAVGDGNHSLATAKACYEQNPTEKNRYALVEVVNVHDEALEFEPIYRIVKGVDPETVLAEAEKHFLGGNREIEIVVGEESTVLSTDGFPVGEVQSFLDDLKKKYPSLAHDYIHGEDTLRRLAKQEGNIGFLFGGMEKQELFPVVEKDSVLPRKTFSMGEAESKRYYMEARRIK